MVCQEQNTKGKIQQIALINKNPSTQSQSQQVRESERAKYKSRILNADHRHRGRVKTERGQETESIEGKNTICPGLKMGEKQKLSI